MTDINPKNPAAPAYEPEKWNSAVTPEMRDKFYADFRTPILNILITERMSLGTELSDANRATVGNYPDSSPERRGWDIQAAVKSFLDYDLLFKDDAKLAERYGIAPKKLNEFKAAAKGIDAAFASQDYAKCLVYAMNDRLDRPAANAAKPGDPPVSRYDARDEATHRANVLKDVVTDGAIDGGRDAQTREGFYRVAVYSYYNPEPKNNNDNIFDSHFVREDNDGKWSHKFGSEPVGRLDKSGKEITDPATADMGNYRFMTYVYVPEGGLAVGAHRPPAPAAPSTQIPDMDAVTRQVLDSMRKPAAEVPSEPTAAVSKTPETATKTITPKQPEFMV